MFFKNRTPQITEDDVLRVLSEVQDPDLHKNIVALGFVKNLKIHGADVSFNVELTTPACPVKDQLKEECFTRVKALPGVETVNVTMTANVRGAVNAGTGRIQLPGVKNVIAVASGKGGVGKSTVAINLTMALASTGAKVGILDADIYGPSIPMMMGIQKRPEMRGERVLPLEKDGIRMISMGFLVPENQPIVWRGPMVHGALTQFMNQVEWGELDYLLIDMPPGTGDAQLTISQNAPLSGAVIVTTPQDISLLDARRGLLMFQNVKVPVLGIIENMSGFVCKHCNHTTQIFRKGGGKKIADEMHVPLLGAIPIDPAVAEGGDSGTPIVLSHPHSEVAKTYQTLAREMAAQLSILQAQASGTFKPLSLEWKAT